MLENTKAEWPAFKSPLEEEEEEAEAEAEGEKAPEGEGQDLKVEDESKVEEDDKVAVSKDDIALIVSIADGGSVHAGKGVG